jgi:hypothetical protein
MFLSGKGFSQYEASISLSKADALYAFATDSSAQAQQDQSALITTL